MNPKEEKYIYIPPFTLVYERRRCLYHNEKRTVEVLVVEE